MKEQEIGDRQFIDALTEQTRKIAGGMTAWRQELDAFAQKVATLPIESLIHMTTGQGPALTDMLAHARWAASETAAALERIQEAINQRTSSILADSDRMN